MVDVTPGWRHIGTVPSWGPISIGGLIPWPLEWHRLDEPLITVQDPRNPAQHHQLVVYELRAPDKTVRFAAGEFSNCIWGFYVPV
jgi:hypothetical protein